jgi:hypothetical protein
MKLNKITAIDAEGNEVVQLALPKHTRQLAKMMQQEYGNVTTEPATDEEINQATA